MVFPGPFVSGGTSQSPDEIAGPCLECQAPLRVDHVQLDRTSEPVVRASE